MAPKWNGFKYAMCNESMQGMEWREQCNLVGKAGYKGIEIAPFTLVKEGVEEISPACRRDMATAMKDACIECAGLHWLLSPPPQGLHVTTPDAAVRMRSWKYFRKLIDFCGDLSGPVMVFGSPKGRNTLGGISVAEATKYWAEGLAKVADHAQGRNVQILIEPLGHNQTDVVNTMGDTIKIVQEINHPAIQTMFDFHNTLDETDPFHVIIEKYFSHIHHIHVQEMDGKYLGSGNGVNDYGQAFQSLKDLRFNGWVSLEVFDFSPGPQTIAQASMSTLKKIDGKLDVKDGV
ncbi:MAG: sugar phosphate isomerase/epimerase [Deltaproteobacteria bacterium]|nr:sugar phosphate isomerase/epimerase [Deltaproteobacteria bacterium]